MKPSVLKTTIILLLLLPVLCYPQIVEPNPNNPNATVSLSWFNDIPRIRYGGTGPGSSQGFQVHGPGDEPKFVVLNSGDVGIGTVSPRSWFPGRVLEVNKKVEELEMHLTGRNE